MTETNVGLSDSSWRIAFQNCCSAFSLLGGLNSNENERPVLSTSAMLGAARRSPCGACDGWAVSVSAACGQA